MLVIDVGCLLLDYVESREKAELMGRQDVMNAQNWGRSRRQYADVGVGK